MIEQEYKLTKPYNKGEFNQIDGDYQVIRLSEGCPCIGALKGAKHPKKIN